MADVVIFKTGQDPQYLRSVHTPDYEGDADVLINPTLTTAVKAVLPKYWKRDGDTVKVMTRAEIDTTDATKLQTRKDNVTLTPEGKAIAKLSGVLEADVINEIRKEIT